MSDDPIERILAAVDGSPHSRAALDVAVRAAAPLGAAVTGLFVKDERLLKTARLSFATEVRAFTAPAKRLTEQRVQRQLRRRARHVERALARRSDHADVPNDFETAEGAVTAEVRAAATDADLLVMGKTSTDSSRRRLGSTSQRLLADAPCPVLVLRTPVPPQQPLFLYYDGSSAAEAALSFATRLVGRSAAPPLHVLLSPHDTADPPRLRDALRARYDDTELTLRTTALSPSESPDRSIVATQEDGILVLPQGCSLLHTMSLQQFLYEADRPLLVVPE